MIDVKFYEVFKEEEKLIKQFLDPSIKAVFTSKTIQEEEDQEIPSKLISIRTQSKIPLEWSEKLKGILSRSQGYDHLIEYKKETNATIFFGYLKSYCSRAVAEHAIMSMMFLLRKTKKQMKNFIIFKRDGITGKNIEKQKALVVGVGDIGYQIVDISKGLNMEVKGVDLEERFSEIDYVFLEEGIAWADIVFCALPLTDKTEGLLNYEMFKNVRSGKILINISRGEISPIADLFKLIYEEKLGGLSLDVYEEEKSLAQCFREKNINLFDQNKKEKINKILNLSEKENVLFTPHNAFNTQEALKKKAELTARSVESFVKTGKFLYLID